MKRLKASELVDRNVRYSRTGQDAAYADALLVVANSTERDAALVHLQAPSGESIPQTIHDGPFTYRVGVLGAYSATVVMSGMGTAAAAITTRAAIVRFRPRVVILLGAAFGRDATTQDYGDVLVSDWITPYEVERIGRTTIYRGPKPMAGMTLRNRFRDATDWSFSRANGSRCRMHIGEMLTGDKLVDNKAFKTALFKKHANAIGGEMEGGGVFAASEEAKVECIVVKGIADFADGKKNDAHKVLASAAAASLVAHVLHHPRALDGLERARSSSGTFEKAAQDKPKRNPSVPKAVAHNDNQHSLPNNSIETLSSRIAAVYDAVNPVEWRVLMIMCETMIARNSTAALEMATLQSALHGSSAFMSRTLSYLAEHRFIETLVNGVRLAKQSAALCEAIMAALARGKTTEERQAWFDEVISKAIPDPT